jgi:hypothetical protein
MLAAWETDELFMQRKVPSLPPKMHDSCEII